MRLKSWRRPAGESHISSSNIRLSYAPFNDDEISSLERDTQSPQVHNVHNARLDYRLQCTIAHGLKALVLQPVISTMLSLSAGQIQTAALWTYSFPILLSLLMLSLSSN